MNLSPQWIFNVVSESFKPKACLLFFGRSTQLCPPPLFFSSFLPPSHLTHLTQLPPPFTILSLSLLSLLSLSPPPSLCLFSGPEIWRIMPLCWSVSSVKPWIWARCKWYDYSLKGTINFAVTKPPRVQRLAWWDNEVNSHSSTLSERRTHGKARRHKATAVKKWAVVLHKYKNEVTIK